MDNSRLAENLAFIIFFGALNTVFIGCVGFFAILYLIVMKIPVNLNMIIGLALLLIILFTFTEVSLYKRNLARSRALEKERWDKYGAKGYKVMNVHNHMEVVKDPDDTIKMSKMEEPVKMVINNEGKIIDVTDKEEEDG